MGCLFSLHERDPLWRLSATFWRMLAGPAEGVGRWFDVPIIQLMELHTDGTDVLNRPTRPMDVTYVIVDAEDCNLMKEIPLYTCSRIFEKFFEKTYFKNFSKFLEGSFHHDPLIRLAVSPDAVLSVSFQNCVSPVFSKSPRSCSHDNKDPTTIILNGHTPVVELKPSFRRLTLSTNYWLALCEQ